MQDLPKMARRPFVPGVILACAVANMKKITIFAVALFSFSLTISLWSKAFPAETDTIPWPKSLPVYDHVVIVVEENKDYEQIIDNPGAGYINGTLRKDGVNLTRMFGEEHNSQG